MTTEWRLLFVTLLCLCGPSIRGGEMSDPNYEGRLLSQWLTDFRDPNIQVRIRAAAVVGHYHPTRSHEAVQVLVPFLKDANEQVVQSALQALGQIGPSARPLVPDISRILKEAPVPFQRRTAAETLGKIGPVTPQVVSALTAALADDSTSVRQEAMTALGTLKGQAREAVPALLDLLKSGTIPEAVRAAHTLGKIGPVSPQVVPALLAALEDTDDQLRTAAVAGLGELGPMAANEIVPALDRLLRKPAAVSPVTVLEALAKLGPASRAALPGVLELADTGSAAVRKSAFETLGSIGEASPQVLAALRAGLGDMSWETGEAARLALVRLGKDAVAVLLEALADPGTHQRAATALVQMGASATPGLIRALAGRDRNQRSQIIAVLASIASNTRQFTPLLTALHDDSAVIRQDVAAVLRQSGPLAQEAIPALLASLQDSDAAVRLAAAQAIHAIEPARTRDAIAFWVDLLRQEGNPHRTLAVPILSSQLADQPELLPPLVGAAGSTDRELRQQALRGLPHFDSETLDRLRKLGRDANPMIRRGVAVLLRQQGRLDPETTAVLVDDLKDTDETVRLLAAEAMQSISPELTKAQADLTVPIWTAELQKARPEQLQALQILGQLGPSAQPAVQQLLPLLADADETLCIRAADSLLQIAPALAGKIVPIGIAALKSKDEALQQRGAALLDKLGADTPAAAPALAAALRDKNSQVRKQTLAALTRLGPAAEPALPELEKALADPEAALRLAALKVLEQLGSAARCTAPALALQLSDGQYEVRQQATAVLLRLGSEARAALPALLPLLKTAEYSQRQQVIALLGSMGPQAQEALPALLEVRDDTNLRTQAEMAIQQIDPDGSWRRQRWLRFWGPLLLAALVLLGLVGGGWLTGTLRRQRRTVRWEFIQDFVRQLKTGDEDTVFDYLARHPQATPQQQRDILLADQAYRWFRGQPRSVAEYLRRCPAMAAREPLILDLLVGDCEGARQMGQEPDLAALAAQFPTLEKRLRQRLTGLGWQLPTDEPSKRSEESAEILPGPVEPMRQETVTRGTSTLGPSAAAAAAVSAAKETVDSPAQIPPSDEATTLAPTPSAVDAANGLTASFASPGAAAQLGPPPLPWEVVPPDPGRVAGPPPLPWEVVPAAAQPAASAFLPIQPETAQPSAAASAAPRLTRIGRYTVEKVLGEGAFGTVYLAQDEDLRRPVAIKVPKRSRVATERDVEMYMAEARILASLDHPGIVSVFDVGRTDDGLCYVVSKYVPGTDLDKRLKAGPLPPLEAVAIILRLAEALDHAHQKRLIHRDIKPANLLLDPQNAVFVTDFGLALTLEDIQQGGQLAGTPMYMSPEQARGEPLDGRSDLFSVGVVFYELLTRQRPFQGCTLSEVIHRIQHYHPQAPHTLPGGISRELETTVMKELSAICMRCLAKRRNERFASGQEVAMALRRWLKSDAAVVLDPRTRHIFSGRLEPYQAADANLYLELLSCGRGSYELPAELHFWKGWLESSEEAADRRVGVLTGPRGSGKSSFVQAGLLPQLDQRVMVIYLRATLSETEARLLEMLRERWPELPANLTLPETLFRLRQGLPAGRKVLLVVDQFERWLCNQGEPSEALWEQVLALCDGQHLQCLLVLTDHFLDLVKPLLRRAALPLEEGKNWTLAKPLSVVRARQTLTFLGQTLRCLPEDLASLTVDQRLFLDRAAAELAVRGEVLPARVASFVCAFREARWAAAIYSQMGGAERTIITMLEERLRGEKRLLQAARKIVLALLSVRSHTYQKLLHISGLKDATLFATALTILDEELKIITPVLTEPRAETGEPNEHFQPRGEAEPREKAAKVCLGYRLLDEQVRTACQKWHKHKPATLAAERFKRRSQQTAWENPANEAKRLAALRAWENRLTEREVLPLALPGRGCLIVVAAVFAVLAVVGFFLPMSWPALQEVFQRQGLLGLLYQADFWLVAGGVVLLASSLAYAAWRMIRNAGGDTISDPVRAVRENIQTEHPCPSCQAPLPADSPVCPRCGHRWQARSPARNAGTDADEADSAAGWDWIALRWWCGLTLILLGSLALLCALLLLPLVFSAGVYWGMAGIGLLFVVLGAALRR